MSFLAFRWYVYIDLLDLFGKLNVTPIIIPGNLVFDGYVIGGSFPALFQA